MRLSNIMKCVSIEPPTNSLTYPSQGCKDIEDQLGDLVIWLIKLKDSMATTRADENREEAERRERLTRFLSYSYHPTDSNQMSL